jgi:bifunctional enzyme CysN/CysC
MARELVGESEFLEVFVEAPLAVVEARDPKGLYKKARAGEIKHFTGIDSPYEAPVSPDIRLDTTIANAETLADRVVERLRSAGYLGR